MRSDVAISAQIEAKPTRGLTAVWLPRCEELRAGATLVQRVLAARGVGGESAESFLHPKLSALHDPSLMPGLDVAAERLLRAANSGEAIVIYGDYDVDGISASAILFHALRAVAPGANVRTYVPHRLEEGYGLNAASVQELCEVGVGGASGGGPAEFH